MKKFLNFRIFFVIFAGLITGTLFAPRILSVQTVFICLFCAAALLLAIACFFVKWRRVCVVLLSALIVGFSLAGIDIAVKQKYSGNIFNAHIEAIATDKIIYEDGNSNAVLRNVKINGQSRGGMLEAIFKEEQIKPGDRVSFTGNITGYKILLNGKINTNMRSGINGFATVKNDVNITAGKTGLFESIRLRARSIINSVMKSEEAQQVTYSVLFGDKTFLDSELKNTFSLAGAAHLLSVSGLHVGLLTAILYFLLKIIKAGRRTKFFVCSAFLLFFLFLCGFSPSVLRASIMVFAFLLASLLGEENDGLQTLCFAGCVSLLIFPLFAFDAGFALSYGCVFGILCLNKPVAKFLTKIHIKDRAAQATAMGISVFISTAAMTAFFFDEIAFVALVSNLILIPLFTLFYFAFFVSICLVLPLSFLAPILLLSEQLFLLLFMFIKAFSVASPVLMSASFVMIILSLIFVFCMSGYVVTGRRIRAGVASVLAAVLIVLIIVTNIPLSVKGTHLYADYSGVYVAKTQSGSTLAICDSASDYKLIRARKAAHKMQFGQIDIVFVPDMLHPAEAISVARQFKSVVCLGDIESLDGNIVVLGGGSEFSDVKGTITINFYNNALSDFVVVQVGDLKILYASQIDSQLQASLIQTAGPFDIAVVNKLYAVLPAEFAKCIFTKTFEQPDDNVYQLINTSFAFKKSGSELKFNEKV